MLEAIANDVELIRATVFYYLDFTVCSVLLLFGINFLNTLIGGRLNYLGIIPRHIIGLPGILLAPLLHGNFNHLFFNSIPLFCLMNMVLIFGSATFVTVTFVSIILSGTLIWLFGRHSIHIGASALIMGYFGFLSINAYLDPSFLSLVLMVLCLYYFGGLVAALIPLDNDGVSVEGHIFGFLAGIASYFARPLLLAYL